MASVFNIVNEGSVHTFGRRDITFPEFAARTYRLLQGITKEHTFDAVYTSWEVCTRPWRICDDIVNPFGDRRHTCGNVYNFNLDTDTLIYLDAFQSLKCPLSVARAEVLNLSQFTIVPALPVPDLDPSAVPDPNWHPAHAADPRNFAFADRLLSDFNQIWRHILRHQYNDAVFRRMANAVVRLASMDFTVTEVAEDKRVYEVVRGFFVYHYMLPPWPQYIQQAFSIGSLNVILDQDLQAAVQRVRKEGEARKDKTSYPESTTYLLLSVRHVVLGQINQDGKVHFTHPETLCNGMDDPSPGAVNLLLHALAYAYKRSNWKDTPLNTLPLEIQNLILLHTSDGPIESARLGCALGIGSTFDWQRRIDGPRKQGPLEVLDSETFRVGTMAVDSKIGFGGVESGVAYR